MQAGLLPILSSAMADVATLPSNNLWHLAVLGRQKSHSIKFDSDAVSYSAGILQQMWTLLGTLVEVEEIKVSVFYRSTTQ